MRNVITIGVVLASLAGCATVVRGAKDTAKFESEPVGATVTAESISKDKLGPFTCVAPCELELKRKREWNVDFTLDGYKPVRGVLTPKVTGGGVASGMGNVIAGGIIGIGVDAGTGANLDLRPNPMRARLAPLDSPEESVILDEKKGSQSGAPGAARAVEPAADPAVENASPTEVEPAPLPNSAPAEPEAPAPTELKMEPVGT